MNRWTQVLLVVLGLCVAGGLAMPASVALADEAGGDGGHRGLGLGVFLGYSKATDAADGALHLGADLSLRILDNHVGGRLEVGYRKDEEQTRDATGMIVPGKVRSVPVLLSLQVLPLGNMWISPFVIAGGSWWYQDFAFKNEGTEWKSSFGWHIGAGVDFNLGSWITLTGDIRWIFLNTNLNSIIRNAPNLDSSGIWVTGGVKLFL